MAPPRSAPVQPAPTHDKMERTAPSLVVVMVGLPARGKTCLSHKLQRYFSWNSIPAKVFSVSDYRRKCVDNIYPSHEFFKSNNVRGRRLRDRCVAQAMNDAAFWLTSDHLNSVAIIDGTHESESIRWTIHSFFQSINVKVLFVEAINENIAALERNVLDILCHCQDYKDMDFEEALEDFQLRLEHYIDQYSILGSPSEQMFSYIKIDNNGEDLMIHKLGGPYQNKVLNFISSYRPTPKTLYFSRHGESEYNLIGRIGGNASLSSRGQQYAEAVANYFNKFHREPNLHVWTSNKIRTKQTAARIDAPKQVQPALDEIDAGVCEGLTYEEVAANWPSEFALRDKDKLRYRYPQGESYMDLLKRLESIVLDIEHHESPLLIVSHQATLRALISYFCPPKSQDEIPYINIPLHTILKLTQEGYNWNVEYIKLNIECVNTFRMKPKNCSLDRTNEEALATVPAHLDSL